MKLSDQRAIENKGIQLWGGDFNFENPGKIDFENPGKIINFENPGKSILKIQVTLSNLKTEVKSGQFL